MSNRLPILASEIRRAHADAQEAARTAAARAIAAGHALIEAKEICAHGDWLPYLVEVGIPERTAQRYQKLAASGLKSDTVSLLGGISSALRFIRLRETAMHHFDNAEAAALAWEESCDGEANLLPPIEWGMNAIEEMVAISPPESIGRASQ